MTYDPEKDSKSVNQTLIFPVMRAMHVSAFSMVLLAFGSTAVVRGGSSAASDAPVETQADVVVPADQVDSSIAQKAQLVHDQPGNAADLVELGRLYIQKGDYGSAVATLSQAITLEPTNFGAFFNRARAYRRSGDVQKAIADYDEAIQLKPGAHAAWTNRGQIYQRMGDFGHAIADETQSIALSPGHSIPYYVRANAYIGQSDYEKAVADFKAAIQLSPNYHHALNNYAWLLATCPDDSLRDGKTAVDDAMQVCRQSHWNWPAPIDTLAAAYAEMGDFDNAVQWEQKFLEYPISNASATEGRERLALYQAHQPYRTGNAPAAGNDDGNE